MYDLILQDVQNIAGKKRVSEDEILEIMEEHPQILEDYKQTNYDINSKLFEEQYEETLEFIGKLEEEECIKKSDLIIAECEEHV